MRILADLHIHSKFSRACSQNLTPKNLAIWAAKKGINVLGTGDFTHLGWLEMLKDELIEKRPGLYGLKTQEFTGVNFLLSVEVASIYKQGNKVRRVHNLIFAPNFESVDKLRAELERRGVNLKADGRPIFKINCEELLKIAKDINSAMEIVPAHVWTPHFGVFGSLSGFNNLWEAFGEMTKHILAVETGLSSDPEMNWRVNELQGMTLISNSDAHSLKKLGREANVFEISEADLSYSKIMEVIRNRRSEEFLYTVEFYPEEGKYFADGHRDCGFSCLPKQSLELLYCCPKCGKKMLSGVLGRVESLASHESGYKPGGAVNFRKLVPLEEILSEVLGVGSASKRVELKYNDMLQQYTEFEILLDLNRQALTELAGENTAEGIIRVREGKVLLTPGYDGEFGKVEIFSLEEKQRLIKKHKQTSLF